MRSEVSGIRVRRINPKDYEKIVRVIHRAITQSLGTVQPEALSKAQCAKYSVEAIAERARERDIFVAEVLKTEELVGIVSLKENRVRTFFVDPDWQGRGIASLLFGELEKTAYKNGVKELELEASPLGYPIYLHFGFLRINDIHKKKNGVSYVNVYMKKKLT